MSTESSEKTKTEKKENRTIWKKYLTLENIVFVSIILLMVGYFGVQTFFLNTTVPQVAVTTTSMVPTYYGYDLEYSIDHPKSIDIFRGDLLIVQNKEPQIGDTIIFKVPDQTIAIVHRIVATHTAKNGTNYFGTKGDNNPQTDFNSNSGNKFGWITEDQVLGVVIFKISHIGWLSLEVQKPTIQFILLASIIIVSGLWVYEYWIDSKKSEEEKRQEEIEEEEKQRKSQSRYKIKFGKRNIPFLGPRSIGYLTISFLIVFYFAGGLVNVMNGSNSVDLMRRDGGSLQEKGISITSNDIENNNIDLDKLYYFNTKLIVTSHGFLNSANHVKIKVDFEGATPNHPFYEWNIVYDFSGSKTINVVIPLRNPDISSNITVTVTLFSSGLMAQAPLHKQYSLMLTA